MDDSGWIEDEKIDRRIEIILKVTNYLSLVHAQFKILRSFFFIVKLKKEKENPGFLVSELQTNKQKTLKNICLPLQMV